MSNAIINAIATVAVVLAGASLAFQQVLNARLRSELASPWWAGFFSYAVGTLVMSAAILAARAPRPPSATMLRVPWPVWTGGLFGAIFVGTAIFAVPRLGAATVLALVVVGQMLAAMTFDRIGLMGLATQPMTPARLSGAMLLIAGVVLVQTRSM